MNTDLIHVHFSENPWLNFSEGATLARLFPRTSPKSELRCDLFNPKEGQIWISPNLSLADSG
jgi:hypothetical protein